MIQVNNKIQVSRKYKNNKVPALRVGFRAVELPNENPVVDALVVAVREELPNNELPVPVADIYLIKQNFHFSLILLAIVDPDGDQTIFSRTLLDADFGPLGRNQHPATLRERTLI